MVLSKKSKHREPVRGKATLKALQLSEEAFHQLKELSVSSGKPMRWHAERAIALEIGEDHDGYRIRDIQIFAQQSLDYLIEKGGTIGAAVKFIEEKCSENLFKPPHPQTSRKHIRIAAANFGDRVPKLNRKAPVSFNESEDEYIQRRRLAGASLSKIATETERRANVILRRLVYITDNQDDDDWNSWRLEPLNEEASTVFKS